ncbi:MAG: glycosyltransferase [Deltaproteobacteria bacterium]|nr:glycosyltransferase [Deltaproteobacteria bacterium]
MRELTAIITSYRSPRPLRLCLLAFAAEIERMGARGERPQVDLIVADDGDPEHQSRGPAQEAAQWRAFRSIRRLWQVHDGYGKCRLANKSALAARTDLLLYLDGDSLLAPGALETHFRLAGPMRYVAGNQLRLGAQASEAVDDSLAKSGRCASPSFILPWALKKDGLETKPHYAFLRALGLGPLLRRTGRGGFNGGCSSLHKSLLEKVNGWDEALAGYGFDDTDLGHRLQNAGAVPVEARLEAMVVHLFHGRPYRGTEAAYEEKRKKVAATLHGTQTQAAQGLAQQGALDASTWEDVA